MSGWWLALAIGLNITAQSADLVTTHQAISSGRGYEANGVMAAGRGPALKAAITVSVSAASIKLWRSGRKKTALAVSLVPAGMSTAVAIHNRRVGR